MDTFSSEEIQRALDLIAAQHVSTKGFVGVFFMEGNRLVVRYDSGGALPASAPGSTTMQSEDGRSVDVTIAYEKGAAIGEHLGEVGVDDVNSPEAVLAGEMGGDRCHNAEAPNRYGTISFYAGGIQLITSGGQSMNCNTAPALVSNNHVIARSDAGRRGELIINAVGAELGRLNCWIPLAWQPSADIAAATMTSSSAKKWKVRQFGALAGIRRPSIGETIRKFGATTGPTTGRVTGKGNISVGGIVHRGVFVTTPGFGCPGDSGSPVIANNNDLLGIYSWAEKKPCDQRPTGYFFTLIKPGRFQSNESVDVSLSVEHD